MGGCGGAGRVTRHALGGGVGMDVEYLSGVSGCGGGRRAGWGAEESPARGFVCDEWKAAASEGAAGKGGG